MAQQGWHDEVTLLRRKLRGEAVGDQLVCTCGCGCKCRRCKERCNCKCECGCTLAEPPCICESMPVLVASSGEGQGRHKMDGFCWCMERSAGTTFPT
jgi:hypothetical protein